MWRCGLTVSKPMIKAPTVTALEVTILRTAQTLLLVLSGAATPRGGGTLYDAGDARQ
jgi:hypothetical protein